MVTDNNKSIKNKQEDNVVEQRIEPVYENSPISNSADYKSDHISVNIQNATFGKNNYFVDQYVRYGSSVFTRTSLLHIQEMGVSRALCYKAYTVSARNSFLLLIVSKGKGSVTQNDNCYNLQAGDCVFLDCKKDIVVSSSEDLLQIHWIFFYGPNMKAIFEHYMEFGGVQMFHLKQTKPYLSCFQSIYEEVLRDDFLKEMRIYEKLTGLLVMLMEECCNPDICSGYSQSRPKKQDLQEVKEYLDQNYRSKITLDSLAEKFFINKFYLARIYKEQFGISITSYLLKVRVMHARQLLRHTNLPIEKVGHECGISDANYFSRMFKKEEGISPGEFRKKGQTMES